MAERISEEKRRRMTKEEIAIRILSGQLLGYAAPDGASLQARMERQHGIHALEHGAEIGLGSRSYKLVNLDG